MRKKQGFTLIELMVVIAIVAILATVGLVTYSNAQKTSRDARRKDDLKQIATALELYKQKTGYYPAPWVIVNGSYGLSASTETVNGSLPWIYGLDSSVINQLPKDPTNASYYSYNYVPQTTDFNSTPVYCVGVNKSMATSCCQPNAYVLQATMENNQDGNTSATLAKNCEDGTPAGTFPTGTYVIQGE